MKTTILMDKKLSDLKSGMVVELRNGDRKLVVGNHLIGEYDWSILEEYNEDMTSLDGIEYEEFDIVKIFKAPSDYNGNKLLAKNNFEHLGESDIIWKRVEPRGDLKSRLKTGMSIKVRNGEEFMIMLDSEQGDRLVSYSFGFIELDDYDGELVFKRDGSFDIVQILSPSALFNGLKPINESNVKEVIWQES